MTRKKEPRPKVLVIDDNETLLDLFEEILQEEGSIVFTADNGLEGIKINKKSNPDIIILDLKMPGMNGIKTLKNIRKTDKDVIVMILTAYGDAQTVREAADLDVYEYLTKPFKNDVVVNAIKEALASKEPKEHD